MSIQKVTDIECARSRTPIELQASAVDRKTWVSPWFQAQHRRETKDAADYSTSECRAYVAHDHWPTLADFYMVVRGREK